jgi:FG-GAP repeat/FG-GAP-like repeat
MKLAIQSIAWILVVSAAQAQIPSHWYVGQPFSKLGDSCAFLGDLDGDGLTDFALGEPSGGTPRVFVYSGGTGKLIRVHEGQLGSVFGGDVENAGDVNADGVPDMIVGAKWFKKAGGKITGAAFVYSGLDGSLLHSLKGTSLQKQFGRAVTGMGDTDQDGYDDFAVACYTANKDRICVYSGRDGEVLLEMGAFLGLATRLARAGDVNGDGIEDIISSTQGGMSAPPAPVMVFSGSNGELLHEFKESSDGFGYRIVGVGDVDQDGYADVAVTAPQAPPGRLFMFSGRTGDVLYTHDFTGQQNSRFGVGLALIGDRDGDGVADLAVGSMKGVVQILSGANGAPISTLEIALPVALGWDLAGGGDVDGDGTLDLLATTSGGTSKQGGGAFVFLNRPTLGFSFCGPATPHSKQYPGRLTAWGRSKISDNTLELHAAHLPKNRLGFLLASMGRTELPFAGGGQGTLCLDGPAVRFPMRTTGPSGTFVETVDLTQLPGAPPVAVMPGETWYFQVWFTDENPDRTSNFTDAVSITFD